MSKENVKNFGNFVELKKYVELSPSDLRERIKQCSKEQEYIDKLGDEFYKLDKEIKLIMKRVALRQLEMKAAVFKGLTIEDIKKYDEVFKEVKDEFGLQSV